jgi:hypothetical protein
MIFAPTTVAPEGSVTLPFSWLADCAVATAHIKPSAAISQTDLLATQRLAN